MNDKLRRLANKFFIISGFDDITFTAKSDSSWGKAAIKYEALKGNKVIAVAIVRPNQVEGLGGLTLSNIEVNKENRGSGIGRRLLQFITNKYPGIYLRPQPHKHSNISEENLRKFYSSEGFEDNRDGLMRHKTNKL